MSVKHYFVLVAFLSSSVAQAITCVVKCQADSCKRIEIEYTTDCDGLIETYTAEVFENNGTITQMSQTTNPEFIGMNAGNLTSTGGGNCKIKDCSN